MGYIAIFRCIIPQAERALSILENKKFVVPRVACWSRSTTVRVALVFTTFLPGIAQAQCLGCWPLYCAVNFDLNSSAPYQINTVPSMPTIQATVTSRTPFYASISWSAKISHTAPSGCSGGPTFEKTVTGQGSSFTPSFGGFYGGTLTVTATCSASGFTSSSSTRSSTVEGAQPSDSAIVAQIGAVGTPFNSADLRRIGCHESGLTQFASSGLPLYGPGGDAGIMQACFQRTNNFLWNWRANVERGRQILNDSKNSAKNHLDSEVANEGASNYPTSYWREEGIHRYNAGTGPGNEYREWNSSAGVWAVVDRGGVGGYVGSVTAQSSSCT